MIIEIKAPSPGESITEVEIANLLVEDGAAVELDQEILEISSDKATLTVAAESDGVVKLLVKAGDVVKVGSVLARIDTEAAGAPKQEKPAAKQETKAETPAVKQETVKAESYATGVPSVSAQKLMEEKGVDAKAVAGTGKDGRVTKTDVVEHLANGGSKQNGAPQKQEAPAQQAPATPAGERSSKRQRMTPLRRKIAERLLYAKNQTAMLTTFNEVDMSGIMELRNKYKDKFKEKYGVGLGFMSFFTRAVCVALKEFPGINAQIDGDEVVYFDYCDIGVAVSTERGLVVPNIRSAEKLDLAGIEMAIRDYAIKARDGKITPDDMAGGTFTITNGGVFGSMLSTPILNPPQSAILGMHNIVERPVAVNGQVVIRPIMYVALSYDHRIVDGKESVSFLFRVKELLEDPSRLLIGI